MCIKFNFERLRVLMIMHSWAILISVSSLLLSTQWKATYLIYINDGSVLVKCRDSVTLSQHDQYQEPETEAAKWNSAVIHCTIYQGHWYHCEKGLQVFLKKLQNYSLPGMLINSFRSYQNFLNRTFISGGKKVNDGRVIDWRLNLQHRRQERDFFVSLQI